MNQVTRKPGYETSSPAPQVSFETTRHTALAGSKQMPDALSDRENQLDRKKNRREENNPQQSVPATRHDVVELHNRIVKMMATMSNGLSEQAGAKAAQDRDALSARMNEMQKAINNMEGILRIEMAPKLRQIVQEELEDQWIATRSKTSGPYARAAILVGVLLLGAVFSDQIAAGGALVGTIFNAISDNFTPLWGHFIGWISS